MIARFKLKFMLTALSLFLAYAGRRFPSVEKRYRERDTAIRIQAGATGHTFVFANGRLALRSKTEVSPTAALVWKDPVLALSVMTSGYDGDMMKAFQNGGAEIRGEAREMFRFFSTLKEARELMAA